MQASAAGGPQPYAGGRGRRDLEKQLRNALQHTINGTDAGGGLHCTHGKARDVYSNGEHVALVSTDRVSAFDRGVCTVPFKGQAVNQCSEWWHRTVDGSEAVPLRSSLVDCPHGNVSVMQACTPLPVEFVVRGFVAGSTSTSLWAAYCAGYRTFCGNPLPDGLSKHDRLPSPILTPTTKSVDGDVSTSGEQVIDAGVMTENEWQQAEEAVLALFALGQSMAEENGLLLADTKYELGRDAQGELVLIDEVHTPDSSRWWAADTFESRKAAGEEPESLDKEVLRLWMKQQGNPYNDAVEFEPSDDLRLELARRYIHLYECITGSQFQPADANSDSASGVEAAVRNALLA